MTVVFWILTAPTVALAALVLMLTLAGTPLSAATPLWLSALASAAVLVILARAWRDQQRGRRLVACGLVIVSWIAFAAVMLVNGVLRTENWH